MKVLSVVGARPQFIKAAPMSRVLAGHKINEVSVHTGQHFDSRMSDIFYSELSIPPPTYQLGIHSLNHGAMTGQMLQKIEGIILGEEPDVVLVYGDTNSTLAGALAAAKLHVPVAHVEAGLRSGDMRMPEEINRILVDRASNLLLCPSEESVSTLRRETLNTNFQTAVNVGDIMIDSVNLFKPISDENSKITFEINAPENFLLATIHRADNTNSEKLSEIFADFASIPYEIILPAHPRLKALLSKVRPPPNVTIIDPVGYLDMLSLITHCMLVLTDSGGLQKEAFYLGKKCITLRQTTEWEELIQLGVNRLASGVTDSVSQLVTQSLASPIKKCVNPYGDGRTADKILHQLVAHFA